MEEKEATCRNCGYRYPTDKETAARLRERLAEAEKRAKNAH